jgi:hypothetical protein
VPRAVVLRRGAFRSAGRWTPRPPRLRGGSRPALPRALAAGDAPVTDFDAAWADHPRYSLHGFLWAVTRPGDAPAEVKAMGERHATAIADHETLALLGV